MGDVWRYLISSMDRISFLMIEFHKYACSNLVAISEKVKDLDQAPGCRGIYSSCSLRVGIMRGIKCPWHNDHLSGCLAVT